MTSKVEELAKRVLNEVVHINRQLSETAAIYEVDLVQSLISAAHAEGVAEGEAKLAKKIQEEGQRFDWNESVSDSEFILTRYAQKSEGTDISIAARDIIVFPASVLAPKEKT